MKKVLSGIIVAAMIISMVGCTKKADTKTSEGDSSTLNQASSSETSDQQEGKEFDFDTFEEAFTKEGFEVKKGDSVANLVGAIDCYSYSVNGTEITVGKFDLNSKNPLTVDNIKKAKDSDMVKLDLQQGGMDVPAKINNNLLIMDYDTHPDKDKIIEVFMGIK